MTIKDELDLARVRLRYDALAATNDRFLSDKPTHWAAKTPTDGISDCIDKEFQGSPPGGKITIRTRAIWRKCVRDRAQLSIVDLGSQRTSDIAKVREWILSQPFPSEEAQLVSDHYGLEMGITFASGPLGGRTPSKMIGKHKADASGEDRAYPAKRVKPSLGVAGPSMANTSMQNVPVMEAQPSGTPETSGGDAGAETLPQDQQRPIQSPSTTVRTERSSNSQASNYRAPNAYHHQSSSAPNDASDRDVQFVQPASGGTSFPSSSQPSTPHAPINDSPNILVSSVEQDHPHWSRHPKCWFDDGSVVIEVHGTLFKVHLSILANGSDHFAQLASDMRKLLNLELEEDRKEASQKECIGGIPVLHVSETSATDFAGLLDAICDTHAVFLSSPPPFNTLASILRASKTLSFKEWSNIASITLGTMWSSDLKEIPSKLPANLFAHAVDAFLLSKEYNLSSVHKRAAYELLRSEILGQQDGVDEGILKTLSKPDLLHLLYSQEKMRQEWREIAGSPPLVDKAKCSAGCRSSDAAHIQNWMSVGLYDKWIRDPIGGLDELIGWNWASKGYCDQCIDTWKAGWRKKKNQVWEKLDQWLGLQTT